jgi:hypothetical protein
MGIFRELKLLMTGEVIQRIDATSDGGSSTISLRLKRERGSGEHYVVLVTGGGGHTQYNLLERDEFEQFSQAVESIRNSLRQAPPPKT